jgi:hypothetical protein
MDGVAMQFGLNALLGNAFKDSHELTNVANDTFMGARVIARAIIDNFRRIPDAHP